MRFFTINYLFVYWVLIGGNLLAQAANKDEAKVGPYDLPVVLQSDNGKAITTKKEWEKVRRPEILRHFENEVYGKTPSQKLNVTYHLKSSKPDAVNGLATRKEIRVDFGEGLYMDILLYVPNNRKKPVPVFVGLNFLGNQSIENDPEIPITQNWQRNNIGLGVDNHKASEATRGASAINWPLEYILSNGYALATAYYCDLFPDHVNGKSASVQRLFTTISDEAEWGAIGTWAWGLSRMVDYLETESAIDASKIAVVGHSRLGKAALWAGVQDKRFGVVIPNNSGEGGTAITRRNFGETIEIVNKNFPHWMTPNYKKYSNNEKLLPVDFHQLVALVAPRTVYVASGSEDWWADPKGEFLSVLHASPVYQLYGFKGLINSEFPTNAAPIFGESLGYHLRKGPHDLLLYDWKQFITFANTYFKITN